MERLVTTGKVTNVDDPAKSGAIKVSLALLDGAETEFIPPVGQPGWLWLPEVGDTVEVLMPNTDDLIEFPDEMYWRGQVRDDIDTVPTALRTNYPKRRGFQTASGHFLIVDETKGQEEITFAHKGTVLISMTNSGIFFGSQDADEPFVLGNQFKTLLSGVLSELASMAGNVAALTVTGVTVGPGVSGVPVNVASFVAHQAQFNTLKAGVDANDQLSNFIKGMKIKPT